MRFRWDTDKQEIKLFVVGPDSKLHFDAEVAYHIAFGNVEPLKGAEVISAMKAITAEVDRIIAGTEVEARSRVIGQ